jgi:hypothetical protein
LLLQPREGIQVVVGQSLARPTPHDRAEFVFAVERNAMIDSKYAAFEVNDDVASLAIGVVHDGI